MTASGSVETTRPVATSAGTSVFASEAASHAKPPTVISRPIWLLGRRSQAIVPAAT